MGMFDFFSQNPLRMKEGGINSLAGNPLMLAGLQILSNSQRGGPKRSLFQGVGQSLTQAAQNNMMMQEAAQRQAELKYRDQERQRAETERAAGTAALSQVGNLLDARNKYTQNAQNLEGLGGGPMQPPPSGNIQSILFNSGNPQLQSAALAQAMQPPKAPISVSAGETLLDPTTNQPIYQAPADPSKLTFEQRLQLADRKGAAASGAGTPFFNFLPSEDGYLVGNARTGSLTPGVVNGRSGIMRATDSPQLQGQIAGAKTGAQITADATTNARLDLPKVEAQSKYMISLIDKALTHPGLPAVVGVPGITKWIPGTPAAGFKAVLAQIKGKQFLQAFEWLKGAGQITEIEGQKATEAEARMDTAQSEEEFKAALTEYKQVIQSLVSRVQQKAGIAGAGGNNPGGTQSGATVSNW